MLVKFHFNNSFVKNRLITKAIRIQERICCAVRKAVTDANILIDLVELDLLPHFFDLKIGFLTTQSLVLPFALQPLQSEGFLSRPETRKNMY